MIEIRFNRTIHIKANKVYRIGMVLNKVSRYFNYNTGGQLGSVLGPVNQANEPLRFEADLGHA